MESGFADQRTCRSGRRFWYSKSVSLLSCLRACCNPLIFYVDLPKTHRILDPDLGGGALLDL